MQQNSCKHRAILTFGEYLKHRAIRSLGEYLKHRAIRSLGEYLKHRAIRSLGEYVKHREIRTFGEYLKHIAIRTLSEYLKHRAIRTFGEHLKHRAIRTLGEYLKHRPIRTLGEYLKCVIDVERFVFNTRKSFDGIQDRIIPFASASVTSSHFPHPSRISLLPSRVWSVAFLVHTPNRCQCVRLQKQGLNSANVTEWNGDYVTKLNPSDMHVSLHLVPLSVEQ